MHGLPGLTEKRYSANNSLTDKLYKFLLPEELKQTATYFLTKILSVEILS